jgi:hypothetical protein
MHRKIFSLLVLLFLSPVLNISSFLAPAVGQQISEFDTEILIGSMAIRTGSIASRPRE